MEAVWDDKTIGALIIFVLIAGAVLYKTGFITRFKDKFTKK